MSSSSDQVRPVSKPDPQAFSYPSFEYGAADAPFGNVSKSETSDTLASEAGEQADAPATTEKSNSSAEFTARLEQERCAILTQAKLDTERELQRVKAEIARAIEQFAQQRDEYFHQAEAEVVSLALAIARRIVHREIQIDPHLLSGLVNYELDQLGAATSIRLLVSADSLSYWQKEATAMEHSVEVTTDRSLASEDVRIETALGSTTVSFESELKEIERGFFDLLSRRPASADQRLARVQ